MKWLLTPEAIMAVFTALVWAFCQGRDVDVLEKLVMALPFIAVPLAFATFFAPGKKTWWWLGRTVLAVFVALGVSSGRAISGFGEGAKGQDAAFLIILVFGLALVSLGSAWTGAWLLRASHAGFGAWFDAHRVLGWLLATSAAVPLGIAPATLIGIGGGLWAAFN